MKYQVVIPKDVVREIETLPLESERKVYKHLLDLETNPHPQGSKKLKGRNSWRIRVGAYRILYTILDADKIILITKVGHRKEVYR